MVTHAVVTLPGQFASRTHEHDGIRVGTHTGRSRSVQLGSPDTGHRCAPPVEDRTWFGFRGAKDIEISEFHDSPPVSPHRRSFTSLFGYELRDVTNLQERPSCEFMAFGLSVIRDCEWAGDRREDTGTGRAGRDRYTVAVYRSRIPW